MSELQTVSAAVDTETQRKLRLLAQKRSTPDKTVSVSEVIRGAIDDEIESADIDFSAELNDVTADETEVEA
jgi:hypothetical protein